MTVQCTMLPVAENDSTNWCLIEQSQSSNSRSSTKTNQKSKERKKERKQMNSSRFIKLSIVALASFLSTTSAYEQSSECSAKDGDNDQTCTASTTMANPQSTCKFYLAPSSIPNAGFGVYTTEAIPKHDPLTESADAPAVLVFDGDVHYPENRIWSMENYFWSSEGIGQFESSSVEEWVVNFGTSCNFHTILKNVLPQEDKYDDTITPRSEGSPGIGAYSYYGGSKFHSNRDIAAGEEIFADYGEDWLNQRPYLQDIPREDDFHLAAEIIEKLAQGMEDTVTDGKCTYSFQDRINLCYFIISSYQTFSLCKIHF